LFIKSGQFSWVNRPNLRILSAYQSGSRNRLTLAQILAHRAGGEVPDQNRLVESEEFG
jgi:hypothetical protein